MTCIYKHITFDYQLKQKTRRFMKTITRASVMNFWMRDISKNNADYIDLCDDFNTTEMGERAAEHFGVMSENGDSEIEEQIFDWAIEFADNHVTSEFK